MNEENTQKLFGAFPRLFRSQKEPECFDGWFQLIYGLSAEIEKEAARAGLDSESWPEVAQIKEKFGTLRYYVRNTTHEIQALIVRAEQKSAVTCGKCGRPGRLNTDGYMSVKCPACTEESLADMERRLYVQPAKISGTVLFLDYDGVLHPDEAYHTRKGIQLLADGHELFEYAELLANKLSSYPDVKIVLSTSWVQVLGYKRAKARLPQCLQDRVIGATWHSERDQLQWSNLSRFKQIYQYVNRHELTDWFAIDNDAQGWPEDMKHHLVHTDDWKGLSGEHAQDDLTIKLQAGIISTKGMV